MDPKDAIRHHLAGTYTGAALLRDIAGWAPWYVPATDVDGEVRAVLVTTDRGPWLAAFSTPDDLATWAKTRGLSPTFTQVDGEGLAALLDGDVAGLDLEPDTDVAIHYSGPQLEALRRMASAVVVGRLVRGEVDLPDAWARLLAYDGYRVPFRTVGDQTQLVLAPDSQSRRLAVVLLAADTVDAYKHRMTSEHGNAPELARLDGQSLYTLLDGLDLDGLVFDPAGPVPPRGVSKAFVSQVLTQGSAGPS